jgi:preprotein translocase YajC subunit
MDRMRAAIAAGTFDGSGATAVGLGARIASDPSWTSSLDPRPGRLRPGSPIISLGILLLIPAAMYFLMIRPQRRRMKEQQSLQRSIEVGDEVVTTSGVYGFITGEDGDKFWLEIDDDVQIRIARASGCRPGSRPTSPPRRRATTPRRPTASETGRAVGLAARRRGDRGGLLALNLGRGNTPVLGLDLQGGVSVILAPTEAADDDDLIVIRDLIRDELESLGIAEPDVRVESSNIVVDLPGVRDQRQAVDAVDVAGIVTLRPVLQCVPAGTELPPGENGVDDVVDDESRDGRSHVGRRPRNPTIPTRDQPEEPEEPDVEEFDASRSSIWTTSISKS